MKKTTMKSAICVLLALLLLLPMALPALADGDGEQSLSVFVASDIHYRPTSSLGALEQQVNLPGDPLYEHTNTKGMLSNEADAIIDEFLTRFEKSDSKYLLIPGDISEDGFWDEHLAFAQKLREFKQRTGKKIYLIPGNHDIRTSDSKNRLNLSDFLEVYADIGFDETLSRHEGTASYTAQLDDDYRLLAIDACIYRQDGSTVSPELFSWIEQQVAQAKSDGKKLIGMVHHSVLEHFAIESIGGNLLCLDDYKTLATTFADWGIKYFFTGHEHANDISTAVSKSGNRIYDIETGSLITYPNAYREVSFSEQSVEIETKYIDKIDTSLLPEGFSAEQLSLMQNDFAKYSYDYFRAGFKMYSYEIPKATQKLAQKLKVEQGTKQYNALAETMDTLSVAVRLPLYDTDATPETDSVEEIAAKAGITLKASDFDNVLDIAAVVYAGHYAGNENLDFDSDTVTLLGQSLNAAFVYALMNVPVNAANILFDDIGLPKAGFTVNDSIYGTTAKAFYMKNAAKTIMREFIRPVANGIICDVSEPDDLNVSLEPYSGNWQTQGGGIAITDASNVLNIIIQVIKALLRAVKAIVLPWA